MDPDNLGRLTYLILLGAAVAGWFLVENRTRLGTVARMAAAWGLIFVGIAAAYGLWGDLRDDIAPRQSVAVDGTTIEVPRSANGHYHLTLTVRGIPVRFIVDTGATDVVLSDRDAERLGIDRSTLAFTGQARTANGTVRTARVVLDDVALDGTPEGRLAGSVGDGRLDISLLGMSYLNRFSKIEIARDRLILTR